MSVEIRVPTLGESVTEATVARWLKKSGEAVTADEPLVELETDKVSLEVPAPASGVLSEITVAEGTDVEVGTVIGRIEEGAAAAGDTTTDAKEQALAEGSGPPGPAGAQAREAERATEESRSATTAAPRGDGAAQAGPAARKIAAEKGVDLSEVPPSGPKGNVTKADVLAFAPRSPATPTEAPAGAGRPAVSEPRPAGREERVRMTRLRKRIAQRLKEAQNTAAMLTTFNEVDMTAVMKLREIYQDGFTKKHGIKLGFMGFFVKATIEALRAYPAVNAEIDGDEIVFKHYHDIGVAVSTEQGLVVPVIRDADHRSLAEIEKTIADLGKRARESRLTMEELTGGTFSITNGGIFGSLMSTPILNPPQVGILGMHKIQPRPMALPDGSVAVRPMMYLALSYDHRIVDGREAVSFLVRLKECIEDPQRILIDA
jgi:2-oxoglutarate dehydrogenase E2 component (dihydrolipoamide succinyltransferase)